MQQGDARQKSKHVWLKAVFAAVLVPGFGVPITKLVESHYDVSFFSPAIMELWNSILSVGDWVARDVTISFWVVALLSSCSFILVLLALAFVYTHASEESGKSWYSLTKDQQLVFNVVADAIENDRQIGHDSVRKISGLSVIATRSALDFLFHINLLCINRDSWGNSYLDLTYQGQEQYLKLGSSQRL